MHYTDIFFDLDGTLIDTISGLTYAFNKVLEALGETRRITNADTKNYIGHGAKNGFLKFMNRTEWSPDLDKYFDIYLTEYGAHQIENMKVYPGIADLLKKLYDFGCNLYVYSNKPQNILYTCIERTFGTKIFSFIEGNKFGIAPKPKPEFMNGYLKANKIFRYHVLYVGDSKVDYELAKKVNIDCAIMTYGYGDYDELRELQPTYMFDKPEELFDLIVNGDLDDEQ